MLTNVLEPAANPANITKMNFVFMEVEVKNANAFTTV
jgi:hypothetical protein